MCRVRQCSTVFYQIIKGEGADDSVPTLLRVFLINLLKLEVRVLIMAEASAKEGRDRPVGHAMLITNFH